MQRFTAFSILLSIVVVLTTVDVLFHDYLNPEAQNEVEVEEVVDTEVDSVEPAEAPVELQEELPTSLLNKEMLAQAGFSSPVLKSALFSGLVFQIISVESNPDLDVLQWNFFDGEQYIGTFYELVYPTDTGAFQGYLSLRESAKLLSDLGSVNEVNMYGDASFYFNHSTKLKTVHMLALYGSRIVGFEYAATEHEKMKKLFDILSSVQ